MMGSLTVFRIRSENVSSFMNNSLAVKFEFDICRLRGLRLRVHFSTVSRVVYLSIIVIHAISAWKSPVIAIFLPFFSENTQRIIATGKIFWNVGRKFVGINWHAKMFNNNKNCQRNSRSLLLRYFFIFEYPVRWKPFDHYCATISALSSWRKKEIKLCSVCSSIRFRKACWLTAELPRIFHCTRFSFIRYL